MRASTQHRPYQGYPYLEPPVHDAPSIDQATASRWANLPRKQVALPIKRTEPAYGTDGEDADSRKDSFVELPLKSDDPNPVVYIDMPESSGSHVTEERSSEGDEEPEPSTYRDENKRDPGDDPVVYIDLPEEDRSVVQSPDNEEPEFVQETIFFDPFENRRIEIHKEERRQRESESDDDVSTLSRQSSRDTPNIRPLPPIRPTTLDLYGPGTSGVSNPPVSSTIPPHLSKETLVYGQSTGDGFPMSPIPVSEFPEPPPAYSEIDTRVNNAVADPVVEQPTRDDPPRTQVILPRERISPTTPMAMGLPNADRKYLNCHHCGMRVHTLVVRENGIMTHVIAIMCLLICMIPIVACIYCTDMLKIKNHYCPNCNKIIGYELPFTGNKIVYVN